MSFINRTIDALPWELHLPFHQYCGPGTKLSRRLARGDPGINELDRSCREHDIAYSRHPDLENRRLADLELSRVAGERFRAADASLSERAAAALVKTAMVLKRKLGAGVKRRKRSRKTTPRVLPLARFGAGRRKRTTARVGRGRRPRGGFVAPLAAALTAGLGAVKTYKDLRNAKRVLDEQQRHHRTLEQIARQRGVRIGAGRGKSGGRGKRKSCARRTIRFL